MKTFAKIIFLILSAPLIAQTANLVGDYQTEFALKDGNVFEYKMTLSQDGTFIFDYYTKIINGIPPEVYKYGKGKWSVENNVISFFSTKEDLDEKYTLDFTNSKARFITKSPRDKTDRIIRSKIQFLKSELFWMERIEMFKQ